MAIWQRNPWLGPGLVLVLGLGYALGAVWLWPGSPTEWAVAAAAMIAAGTLGYAGRVLSNRPIPRLLGYAALAWFLGAALDLILRGLFGTTNVPLTFGDLFALIAVALFWYGIIRLAPPPRGLKPRLRHIADTYVCASSLFVVVWVLWLQPLHAASGESWSTFALVLVLPVLDIFVLCGVAPLVVTAPRGQRRLAATSWAAFAVISAADLLGTFTQMTGVPALGGAESPLRVVAFALLAYLPVLAVHRVGSGHSRITGRGLYRFAPELAAAGMVAVATCVLAVHATRSPAPLAPVLPLVAGSVIALLLLRMLGLMADNFVLRRSVATWERHFHALAESTGDVILIIDAEGVVHYASPGSAESYGYRREAIVGRPVEGILHPEDLPRTAAALAAFRRGDSSGVRLRTRVAAADGTWRHTESTTTRYQRPGEPERLLVAVRDITAQVSLQEQLEHLTFHDGVTALPNRAYLEERTREIVTRGAGGHAAAIFLDLDGFTAVNDSAGHAAGDLLLTRVARRLRAAVPPGDTLARWGGDEFAVLIENVLDAKSVVDLADRLAGEVSREPFQVGDTEIALSASVGVAFADENLDSSAELLRNADVAMARAKDAGGGQVELFASHMHADVVRRLELQSELRRALADGDFTLEYQPIVDLAGSQVLGVEALLRWWRDGVLVPPDSFIGPAEESGLIVELGAWTMREAFRTVVACRASSWDIGLSVNLSARQIRSPRFVEDVAEMLAEAGLPPDRLTLEVTEEMLVEEAAETVPRLRALRELGVRLAIDDFGTGYASLVYLRQLPVDAIKIDPSFTAALGDDQTVTRLTRTIVRLGQDLGMTVVAEGIERPEQLDLLREMGCAHGQGFLVARPMSAAGVAALAEERAGRLSVAGTDA
ncbi:EAL domain-containing protein [Allonocardiopsis opalescens]|uniref:PAS domain S-box-containing protein/diguanylate cyclase (GGDEF)-like protein n=1 Tax=Allonocardiopsis opalescens TaxID=1144618 RepID=A0A2T0QE57_9ACTN|nr:EAL domain-containing protein [Allonocardiopsis opalescens]PRY02133.1 PAS domain S-box-containing protein/diguanylate cyclase (GGDEF)-like protein [Allonocardiopsis opalescens]